MIIGDVIVAVGNRNIDSRAARVSRGDIVGMNEIELICSVERYAVRAKSSCRNIVECDIVKIRAEEIDRSVTLSAGVDTVVVYNR